MSIRHPELIEDAEPRRITMQDELRVVFSIRKPKKYSLPAKEWERLYWEQRDHNQKHAFTQSVYTTKDGALLFMGVKIYKEQN